MRRISISRRAFASEAPRPFKTPVFLGGFAREDERLTDWFHGHRRFLPKAHSLDEGRQRQSKPYEGKIVLFPLEMETSLS